MDRIVRDLTTSRRNEEERPHYFSEYAARSNIVLLGDPGAGKSHLFRTFAGVEGGRFVTVRGFLAAPVRAQGETLFIDGLDEKRAGRGDRDTVDALVGKLFDAGPAKVRLSCRVADWLGETDLRGLSPYFAQNGGEPTVLALTKLSEEERRAVLAARGISAADTEAFLKEAEQRGLREFLENPQNLLMLLGAVQTGQWPPTRTALFQLSTALMLQEADRDHARRGSGVRSVNELRPPAGAILAARLISDIDGIGLFDQEGSASVPGYRTLSFIHPDLVSAALTRRIFVAGSAPESVDYAHRTTAEYLGAAWLANAVRGGLPFGRLQALMGVDGHPAPELRGLHAWLAVHLPEYADRIIDADPYGVLTYGDAASLSREHCAHLMRALGRLSQTDPWFRSGHWDSPAIGALSRTDMVEEFRSVMRDESAGFGIRSIVAEALAQGTPQSALKDDLAAVLVRNRSTYAERYHAVRALLRLGTAGKEALRSAYRNRLGNRVDELRLRVDILHALYGEPFGPAEVVTLINEVWASPDELPGGVLWFLADRLPLADLQAVLDGVQHRKRTQEIGRRNAWEIGNFYDQALVRAWNELTEIEPGRALNWLRVRHAFRDSYSGAHDRLASALRANPERLAIIADHFLETFEPGERRSADLFRFQEVTLHLLSADAMLEHLVRHLAKAVPGSAKRKFLYEAAIHFTWQSRSLDGRAAFDKLYALGDADGELRAIRDAMVTVTLPERYLERKVRQHAREEAGAGGAGYRERFEQAADKIRSGEHLGWLDFLAKIYFGIFSDLDSTQTPQQRLASIIGEPNVPAAMEGLCAVLNRNDLPQLADVAALAAEHQHYDWWYAIIAAMDERFAVINDLAQFSDELLSAAIAFSLTSPVFEERDQVTGLWKHAWKIAALARRPELVRDAYAAVARAKLAKGDQHTDGLDELMTDAALAPYRGAVALEFLRDFPNANIYRLNDMLDGVLATPDAHAAFLALAAPVVAGTVLVDPPQRDRWLATAYLLAPLQFEQALETTARARPGLIFDLRDLTGGERRRPTMSLTLAQLEFLARLTGSLYPNTAHLSSGWSGDTNAWDASEYFIGLVNAITANPSDAATAAINRLEADAAHASYKPFLLNAKARQQARRRETEYDRPDWAHTVAALDRGPPATTADLHALLIAHLDEVRERIARSNTDQFKAFWNLDAHARTKSPRPEEGCRDTVVDLLRVGLAPLGIMVEPEGHMALDKRADISAAMPARRILCELKRDYHADVWTAMEAQLERFYVQDPDAHGFGIYMVFWFGTKRPSPIRAPPEGRPRPRSPGEMEEMLRVLLPPDRIPRIAVRVIDVSGEFAAASERKFKRSKKRKASRSQAIKPPRRTRAVKKKTLKVKQTPSRTRPKSRPTKKPRPRKAPTKRIK
jgi:predicted NACHT family NTPase